MALQVGELYATLGLDNRSFVQRLLQTRTQLQGLGSAADAVTGKIGSLAEALNSSMTGVAANVFDAVGDAARSMPGLFPRVIEQLDDLAKAAERGALASRLFARSAGEIKPVLQMNQEEFKALTDQANSASNAVANKMAAAAQGSRRRALILGAAKISEVGKSSPEAGLDRRAAQSQAEAICRIVETRTAPAARDAHSRGELQQIIKTLKETQRTTEEMKTAIQKRLGTSFA